MNIRPLLRVVCSRFFGDFTGFVDMIAAKVPAAKNGVQRIVDDAYSGTLKTDFVQSMVKSEASGPLVVYVTKLFTTDDATRFHAYGRVLSGTLLAHRLVLEIPKNSKKF